MVEGMKVTDWRQEDRQSGKVLSFSIWNAKVRIQVYDRNNMKDKIINKGLSDAELVLVEKNIAKVVSSAPEQKFSIQFQTYDRNSKQFRIEAVLTFEKDSKQIYKITISDAQKNASFTFSLKASATVTTGSEPLSDAMLSALKLETLKDWLTGSKIWAPFTFVPPPANGGGNRGGGYGGGNRGGGGYSNPTSAPMEGGTGDLPF